MTNVYRRVIKSYKERSDSNKEEISPELLLSVVMSIFFKNLDYVVIT